MPVDPRAAARTLAQIAAYLELQGENRYKARAYQAGARAVLGVESDDLDASLARGELAAVRGLGPATLAVLGDLVEHGQSLLLEQLRTTTPEGLLEMLRVPGLNGSRVFAIHKALGIETLDQLERAARDGRLAAVPRFGKTTVDRILGGIAMVRAAGAQRLYNDARDEGQRLLALVTAVPGVVRATVAGPLRRHCETVGRIEIVAECREQPRSVAAALPRNAAVKQSHTAGSSVDIELIDGVSFRVHCTTAQDFGFALVAATGDSDHVAALVTRLLARGFSLGTTGLERNGQSVAAPNEETIYELAGLQFVDPALRESRGELEAASAGSLPTLVTDDVIRGVFHCHTVFSDGTGTIEQMARAARRQGWSYLGISDHSRSASYAGGLTEARLEAQLAEIDRFNASHGDEMKILKGIEADILVDGQLDYPPHILDRFDFVVGAIHSRFTMTREAMTQRVLRAMDAPQLTILAHPTGRRLLSREAYPIDVDAVLERAAERGIAVELNADPRRLDLDWRYLMRAKELGVQVAIGPDAHSAAALDNTSIGVGMARKGWLEAGDVLNTRSADDVIAFARARRGT